MTHTHNDACCSGEADTQMSEALTSAMNGLVVSQGDRGIDRLLRRYTEEAHPEIYDCRACEKDITHCSQELIVEGQQKRVWAVFNSCSDSRGHAGMAFRPRSGEIFQIADAGLLLTPHDFTGLGATVGAWGSIQYGLSGHVGAEHFVQFGHTKCGAMKGLLEMHFNTNAGIGGPLLHMLKAVEWMVDDAEKYFTYRHGRKPEREEMPALLEQHNVRKGAELVSDFVKEYFPDRKIQIHPWLYDLEAANILRYDTAEQEFTPITNMPRRLDYNIGLPHSCQHGMDEIETRLGYPDGRKAAPQPIRFFDPKTVANRRGQAPKA